MGNYSIKTLKIVPFVCSSTACPKHLDRWNAGDFSRGERGLKTPLADSFAYKGCAEFRTRIYGLSVDSNVSQAEWDRAPTLAVVLPSPDPTGAQAEFRNNEKVGSSGICDNIGFSRDVIFDSLMKSQSSPKPLKVAFIFLTRGYSFKKFYQGDLINEPVSKAAVGHCMPYFKQDVDAIKPDKILLCGFEAGELFFPGKFEIAEFRRQRNLQIEVAGKHYPAQVTYNPHFTSVSPPILKCLWEDCDKLWGIQPTLKPGRTRILRTLDEVMEYMDFLSEWEGFISVDTETANLNRKASNKLGTIQFATDDELGVVLPYQHSQTPFDPYELEIIKMRQRELFMNPIRAQGWIAHNAKFEHTVFKNHFGTFMKSAPVYDTQAMAFLLDETRSERKKDIPSGGGLYSLKQLARDLLGWEGYDKGILKFRSDGALLDLDLETLSEYAAMDAWVTYALFWRIQELAQEQDYLPQLLNLAEKFYSPATRLIAHIEMSGFKADLKHVRNLAARKGPFEKKLDKLEADFKTIPTFQKANEIVASELNAGNPHSVLDDVPWVLDMAKNANKELVFFKLMGLDPVSWSDKTGRPSIDDEFFEAYSEEYPEVKLFASYEEVKKMKNTFVTKTLERIDPESGDADCKTDQRIRPDIHYSRLVTGRWAMLKPNLGQVPKASEEEQENPEDIDVRGAIKDIFTVDQDCALIQIDYKVNEVRWAAILAQDEALGKIFCDADKLMKAAQASEDPAALKEAAFKEDVHRNTAAETFGKKLEEVTKPERQASKAITFGILFQSSAKSIAESLGIPVEKAEGYIKLFFSRMVGVFNWITAMKQMVKDKGFVESPDGRRRRFWGTYLPDSCPNKRSHCSRNERQAVNAPIQGIANSAAMVGGVASLLDYIEDNEKPWLIQNVVHDSALVQVPKDQVVDIIHVAESIFAAKAQERMEDMGVKFNLPLGIDVEVGIKWGTMTKWIGTKTHAHELQEMIHKYWRER